MPLGMGVLSWRVRRTEAGESGIKMKHVQSLTVLAAAILAFSALPLSGAPVAPNPKSLLKSKKVLVVEATKWNENSHTTPKANALALLKKIKTEAGFSTLTVADNVEAYTAADLAPYDIIVFNYVFNTQYAVGKPFEAAFKAWFAAGNRGWMGYHSSGANDVGEWPWYRDSVTVMRYHVHTVNAQPGKMNITTDAAIKALPVLQGMDASFTGTDEWYDFDLPPRAPAPALWADCKVTYYLDESSLAIAPSRPMNPHPMSWIREDGKKNRFYFSAFVHSNEGSSSDFFHSALLRGLEYVAGYDTAVSISSAGNSVRNRLDLAYVTGSRELRVENTGPHKLEILSAQGRLLERLEGKGRKTYRPRSMAKAGVYCVRFQGNGVRFTQRMLVY
jgi:hypothetical protein